MNKKEYITPEVVTVEVPKQPLMAGSPAFNNEINEETTSGVNALSKGGGWLWSDDEPEDYEE